MSETGGADLRRGGLISQIPFLLHLRQLFSVCHLYTQANEPQPVGGLGPILLMIETGGTPAKFPTHKASPPCEVKNPLNNHASERVSGCSIGENPGWCKNRRGPTCFLHKHTYLQKLVWSGPVKLCTDVANAFPLEQAIWGNLWKIPTREISDSLYKWHQRNLEFSAGWGRFGPNRMLSAC